MPAYSHSIAAKLTVATNLWQDYTVSITCTDQLLPLSNGSYELFFSRIPRQFGRLANASVSSENGLLAVPNGLGDDNDDAVYNPHEDAEPFLKHVLRHGPRLSSSLHQLVGLLRDSLPVVCVLDSIRKGAESGRDKDAHTLGVETFAKAAGWFRVLYGDMRLVVQRCPRIRTIH